tara:strand:- start:153 stop:911 length:759 start_codon:yes stop_codon:yes gene_type:complete
MDEKRQVCWFSCGAASAVATKLALGKYKDKNCVIVNEDTGSEHPDNERFKRECEEWFGQEVITIKSDKYEDIWDVFKKTRYLVGPGGARCTGELKRRPAEDFLDHFHDREIFGYTIEERHRMDRFREQNPERFIECPLIDEGFDKADCLGFLERVGIELPVMYKLGFHNNNCIGCVKGGAGYWNKIRKHFPDVFDRMAKQERELGVAINKSMKDDVRTKIFLDELPEDMGNVDTEPSISCGLFCMAAADDLE